METKDWKWFRYDEIFDVKKGKRLTKADMIDGDIPYVGAIDSNNGISAHISNNVHLHSANTITVSYNGSIGYAYYQREKFWATDDVNVLYPKFELNEYVAEFLCSLIEKEQYRFCYGRKWDKELMEKSLIKLPIDANGDPDWLWIENYVKTSIVPKLSPKAKSVWQNHFNKTPLSNKKLELKVDEWQWFRVGELFEIKSTKGTTTTNMLEGSDILYIAAKKELNGVNGTFARQGNEDYISQGNCIVFIQIGEGSAGYVTYQPYNFIGMSGKTSCGYNKHLNAYNGEFLVTILDKERQRYSFGRSWTGVRLSYTKIKLPAIKNAQGEYEPDWQFMEDYIKSLPYSGCLK